ncbi:hypothetical protein ASG56_13250 [Rhodococcus sp. Leaf7]|uniref:ANTAR domain-containing protein n=1 Tax=unclassified Rhodococcus (in: high G+C Gram-positive bacteria) TaxID=192944 RepID=UPI0005ACF953|nr:MULTISPECIES: ANTAR domain-containing protein [unclassified Rhodococcus (in: high G+C Gram-positive bacteria)]KQU04334.1 hypothetical protein ASG56_13250 [Rhodococcus sp. Leaf7]KQU40519.1 hypothetical protein ASG64_13240 [Rhodococcus sp. Leaf247]
MSYTPDANVHRREIDLAVGVLIALRSVSEGDAFVELADHARSTGSGLVPSARALVALARGHRSDTPAGRAAERRWGSALNHRSPAVHTPAA